MNLDRPTAAVARGRLRERLATLKAICALTEPDAPSFRRALDAVLALDERQQDELADVMFASAAEAAADGQRGAFDARSPTVQSVLSCTARNGSLNRGCRCTARFAARLWAAWS
jgi:hypothetical protein